MTRCGKAAGWGCEGEGSCWGGDGEVDLSSGGGEEKVGRSSVQVMADLTVLWSCESIQIRKDPIHRIRIVTVLTNCYML